MMTLLELHIFRLNFYLLYLQVSTFPYIHSVLGLGKDPLYVMFYSGRLADL